MASLIPDMEQNILDAPFDAALGERYLVYALSTITARSLPDLRDGLKPVHRRLLWAMRLLRLNPDQAYKKCARVVGDVIGKYHPHGDASVYDAMVRLAQDFALRVPLVDGQGNFGNIDGDNAAAMRYTEARLTDAAIRLMDGLDEESVPFRTTYNGEEEEPEVFPGLFPNLLVNGAAGIAVGMATSIPPHNPVEIVDAALHLLHQPDADTAALLQFVGGPDFPTGGVLVEPPESIAEAYATGRGSFRLRARWAVEDQGRGTWTIIISEVPYQVLKGKLIEQLASLITEKKLPILADVADESDEAVRIVITPKSRNVDADVLMESLFKLTDLEVRVPLNMNVLDEGRPGVLGLKPVIAKWLVHQREVLLARSRYRLGRIDARLEVLGGLLKAYLNLDEVIRIIREADDAKAELKAAFDLTDVQAEAILNMRLRSLRKLEEIEITLENKALTEEARGLRTLIADPAKQTERLAADLTALRTAYGPTTALGRRRTSLAAAPQVKLVPIEAMIEKEPITIICSAKGWIRAMKGHADLAGTDALKFKEGDGPAFAFHAQTTDRIVVAASDGRFYTLMPDRLPGGRGFGEPLRLMIDLAKGVEIVSIFTHQPERRLLLAASDGRGFQVDSAELLAETRKGKAVMNPRDGSRLAVVRWIAAGDDMVAVIGENRKLLVFPLEELPQLQKGQGVALQKYKDGGMSDVRTFVMADGLSWPMGGGSGRTRTEADLTFWKGARASAGRMPPTGFPRDNKFSL
ncbi:DNA topoisomerase IV subunit A [Sandarakinorhabdus cyanobacteriorum]|uniref:DNA topoisomerase 4 subunit A n=1 Tax=Sandarakinorhabdus cyanobacteriorum TaxID=1981098 RepID=A0A255YLR9_9SPHN|nr:DNA topoisomerase IV subunit A [Sandarakinorhabdus cyanobacteriorum]OYQ29410.1 DNA topoisomerase IV subunit A [Sandarakinorhabdus cyanobacteriorum]